MGEGGSREIPRDRPSPQPSPWEGEGVFRRNPATNNWFLARRRPRSDRPVGLPTAMAKQKTVVLCSGGLNSAVTASIAAVEDKPALLHARVGHRASDREVACFEKLADHLEVDERLVVDLSYFRQVAGSARFHKNGIIEDAMAMGDGPSHCHIPGLIGALLSAAFAWAWSIHATRICIGISENLGPPAPPTSRIYPDYTREFVQLNRYVYEVAAKGRTLDLETPLLELNRADIIRLGKRLKTPFDMTWSCVAGALRPCGRCVGCATRNRGFLDAAVPDPIMLPSPDRPGSADTRLVAAPEGTA